jgi:hypothetical protein
MTTTTTAAAGAFVVDPRNRQVSLQKFQTLGFFRTSVWSLSIRHDEVSSCVCVWEREREREKERERERERERDPSQVLPHNFDNQMAMWPYIALCEYWKSASRFVDFCKPETVTQRERERSQCLRHNLDNCLAMWPDIAMYEHRKSASRSEGFGATQNRGRRMTGNWQCKSSAIMRREKQTYIHIYIHTFLLQETDEKELWC